MELLDVIRWIAIVLIAGYAGMELCTFHVRKAGRQPLSWIPIACTARSAWLQFLASAFFIVGLVLRGRPSIKAMIAFVTALVFGVYALTLELRYRNRQDRARRFGERSTHGL